MGWSPDPGTLADWQLTGWERARDALEFFELSTTCAALRRTGTECTRPAGWGTEHEGYGRCRRHRGNRRVERAEAAWMAGHRFAQEYGTTPWEGLLTAVRVAAGKLAYCEWVLSTATHDLELEGRVVRGDDGLLVHPDTGEPLGVGTLRDLSWWVRQSAFWHDRLLRSSKLAVDAGVAERMVAQVQLDAQAVARVLESALGAVGDELSAEQSSRVRAALRAALVEEDERADVGERATPRALTAGPGAHPDVG